MFRPYRSWLIVFVVLTGACERCREVRPPVAEVGAGNYCSLVGKVLWTSNRGSATTSLGVDRETFNIFVMNDDGGEITQLTHDAWPVVNQHPVFTPDCQEIVWARGPSGGSRIWTMRLDGTDQRPLDDPPAGEVDGHPWVSGDGRVYFVRHEHPDGVHRLWRMEAGGADAQEILGTNDRDRFHPAVLSDNDTVIYTAGPPGSRMGTEIRILRQSAGTDEAVLDPGWQVSAATPHPDGKLAILAEDHNGDGSFRLIEIDLATGSVQRTLTNDQEDNTIPYYSHPDGAAFDWIQWRGPQYPRQSRNLAWAKADLSEMRLLTNDAWEDTKIVGELEVSDADGRCVPRPVGCYPTPPPCAKFLLPKEVAEDAEELGRKSAELAAVLPQVPPDAYLEFTLADLERFQTGQVVDVGTDLLERVERLGAYVTSGPGDEALERIAELYVNSLLAAF